jgi:hypothetical protein
MNNLGGKNAPRVVERRTVVQPPELVGGSDIRVDMVENRAYVHSLVNLVPIKENLEGLQSVVEALRLQVTSMYEKTLHTGEAHKAFEDSVTVAIGNIYTEMEKIDAKPAQQILTRTVERPGVTLHELRIEHKTPSWVWILLTVLAANAVYQLVSLC